MLKFHPSQRGSYHIIGCGGTGGYLTHYLARLLAGTENTIHLYDGDEVEEVNLKRQNFRLCDLGHPKSTALAEFLTTNLHQCPTIVSHPEYITDKDKLVADLLIGTEAEETCYILSCVDNVATRKLINEAVDDLKDLDVRVIAMDSGNDDQGGQVVLSANYPVTFETPFDDAIRVTLQTLLQVYPELATIKDTNPGVELSCEEAAEKVPQAMLANVRNAEVMTNVLASLLETGSVSANHWRSSLLTGETKSYLSIQPGSVQKDA